MPDTLADQFYRRLQYARSIQNTEPELAQKLREQAWDELRLDSLGRARSDEPEKPLAEA